jgi:uncharacterized protein YjbJ (UPF0337 family)
MLNEQQFRSKWNEIKGGIRNLWGKLTDEDLEMTKGSLTSIAGLVEKKYGETKDDIRNKLKSLMSSFENSTDKGTNPDRASYQRKPDGIRTTETSQNQDIISGEDMRDVSTKSLDEKSFEARKANIGSASYNGSSENSAAKDFDSEEIFDEGVVGRNGTYLSSINGPEKTDRITGH